jgi:hypothetical protein
MRAKGGGILRRYWRKETKKPKRGDWRENRERHGTMRD